MGLLLCYYCVWPRVAGTATPPPPQQRDGAAGAGGALLQTNVWSLLDARYNVSASEELRKQLEQIADESEPKLSGSMILQRIAYLYRVMLSHRRRCRLMQRSPRRSSEQRLRCSMRCLLRRR